MIDRNPPNSVEAENGFLGSCLISSGSVEAGSDLGLKPDDFYRKENAVIWAAMQRLVEQRRAIDIVTVAGQVEEDGNWPRDGGVRVYLAALSDETPTFLNAPHYAKIVFEKSLRRRLLDSASLIANIAYNESQSVEEALDQAETALKRTRDKAPTTGRDPNPVDIISRMEGARFQGIPTRLRALNVVSSGMVRGHLWVVGGFTSIGKSVVASNLVEDAIKAGASVMVASLEMSQEQYMLRLISLMSSIPHRVIRNGGLNLDQALAYRVAREFWLSAPIRIYDNLYNMARIRRTAKKMKEQMGLDVLVVDFIQNISETGDEIKDARLAIIGLQQLATELNCCVVALSQVSNAQAQNLSESGVNSSYFAFKGSGAIAHAADVAIILDRDKQNAPDVLWFHVVKNRHDETTRFAARLDLPTGRVDQMTEQEQQDADPNGGRKGKRSYTAEEAA